MATIYTLIDGDTWVGLYANDSLVYEDHSISASQLLDLVNYTAVEFFGKFECDLDWLYKRSSLPEQLEDVQMRYCGVSLPFYECLERMNNEASMV